MTATILSEAEAKEILEPHLPTIKKVMLESLDDLNKAFSVISESINKRARCSLLHSIAIEKVKKALINIPHIVIKIKYQTIQIIFSGKIIARIKKVNKNLISSNARTFRNEAILHQRPSLFPEMTSPTFVDLGYEIDNATWSDYKRHVVVCRLNDSVSWHIDFTEIEQNVSSSSKEVKEADTKIETQIKIKKA